MAQQVRALAAFNLSWWKRTDSQELSSGLQACAMVLIPTYIIHKQTHTLNKV